MPKTSKRRSTMTRSAERKNTERKSTLTYLHQKLFKEIKNDTVVIIEEKVMDGPKGISFKYYHKEGGKITKISGRQESPGGNFVVMGTDKPEADTKDLSLADTIKLVKSIKGLEFVVNYLSNSKKQKGGYYHYGGRRRSRKSSRRTSRKSSRKSSRKGSRKSKKHMGGARRKHSKKSRKTSRR